MSAAVGQSVLRDPAGARAHETLTEPAWPWPIDLTRYDRTPALSASEADALRLLAEEVREWHRPRTRRSAWHALDRLIRPLADVRSAVSICTAYQEFGRVAHR
jgi:hypothetical protein